MCQQRFVTAGADGPSKQGKNIGALVIRKGFGVYSTIIIMITIIRRRRRSPKKPLRLWASRDIFSLVGKHSRSNLRQVLRVSTHPSIEKQKQSFSTCSFFFVVFRFHQARAAYAGF